MQIKPILVAAAAFAAMERRCGAAPERVEASAAEFVSSVGVNTHLEYDETPYAQPARVLSALSFLGVRRVRDSAFRAGPARLDRYLALADGGAAFDLFVSRNIADQLGEARVLKARRPAAVEMLEGPNEINNEGFDDSRPGDRAAAARFQRRLLAATRSTPSLASLPVAGLTSWPPLWAGGDLVNFHSYRRGGGRSLAAQLDWDRSLAEAAAPEGLPAVCTETGQATAPDGTGRDEVAQAREVLVALEDNFAHRVIRTYVYELFDEPGADPRTGEGRYGLFRSDGTPKLAAEVLARLLRLLNEADASSGSQAPLEIRASAGAEILRLRRRDGALVVLPRPGSAGDRYTVRIESRAPVVTRSVDLLTGTARPRGGGTVEISGLAPFEVVVATPARTAAAPPLRTGGL